MTVIHEALGYCVVCDAPVFNAEAWVDIENAPRLWLCPEHHVDCWFFQAMTGRWMYRQRNVIQALGWPQERS